ncbi:glycosyltransferase family 4 protein [Patescibacteria group bacterium]|nr:glycosyltransferase family 4 protein [Patescibacteria group bacterium]
MISARLLDIPTTFTVLDYFIICPKSNFLLNNGKICQKLEGWCCLKCVSIFRVLERAIIKSLAKNLKRIITFTQTSKSRLVSHGLPSEKIEVKYIYDFSSEVFQRNKKKINKIKNTILFVGSFHKHKGLDILIRALPDILAEVPEAKMVVVGTGNDSDKTRIENIVSNLKLVDNIEFLGQKKNEETLRIISKSEIVVVPEQWLSDFGPIILIEAMSLGRPVVASKIGATSEFIKDGFNGFLVERSKPEEFAKKIIWLLKNKKTAQEIGEKAEKSFQMLFDFNQEKKIIKLYTNL